MRFSHNKSSSRETALNISLMKLKRLNYKAQHIENKLVGSGPLLCMAGYSSLFGILSYTLDFIYTCTFNWEKLI